MSTERDVAEDTLRDAAHDAFMAFWRAAECEQAALWAAYCAAQVYYEAYLMCGHNSEQSAAIAWRRWRKRTNVCLTMSA
ncbi:MAG TPA: hypothetical protein VKE41_15985 [Roseiflexaceae bacterium]|nr:hypothetical protein [Roseiflexaceae bacterium]